MDRIDPAFQARRTWYVAAVLGLVVVVLLALTAPDIGLTWDEPAYIAASESYMEWFQLLARSPRLALHATVTEKFWQANHEHPPLDKIWSGFIWNIAKNYMDDLTAHRLGNMIAVGGLAAMLYFLMARHGGWSAGLMAVVCLISMPRFFFHAHLAALDVPAAVMVFATVFAFWLLKDRDKFRWDLFMGLIWGLALATKINALFVPPMLLLWWLIFDRRMFLLRRLGVMGVVALIVFRMVWPWLYDGAQFWPRLLWYIRFVTVDHWKIGQYYLGQFWMPPPWHFPLVIVLAVVPPTVLLLALTGGVCLWRKQTEWSLGGLLLLNLAAPLVIPVLGRSLLYDNDRLFMPVFPFLAAWAGLGASAAGRWLDGWVDRRLGGWKLAPDQWIRLAMNGVVMGVVAIAALTPQVVAASGLYPHLLSYYSGAVGGLRGATRLGLETTYWCETYAVALPHLNRHARPGDVIWVDPWSHDVLFYYQREGRLRDDVQVAWPENGSSVLADYRGTGATLEQVDWVLVQHRQTSFDNQLRFWLKWREPVVRLEYRGIPLMELYKNGIVQK